MKLRNKKTGEIMEFDAILPVKDVRGGGVAHLEYDSLAELNEEWEDYEEPKEYWAIDCFSPDGDPVSQFSGCSEKIIENRKQIGNYFETKEEAEKAVERLRAWKRLKDKGLEVTEWSHGLYLNKTVTGRFRYEFPIDNKEDIEKDLDLLFGGGDA